jgi:hypothetical protein
LFVEGAKNSVVQVRHIILYIQKKRRGAGFHLNAPPRRGGRISVQLGNADLRSLRGLHPEVIPTLTPYSLNTGYNIRVDGVITFFNSLVTKTIFTPLRILHNLALKMPNVTLPLHIRKERLPNFVGSSE